MEETRNSRELGRQDDTRRPHSGSATRYETDGALANPMYRGIRKYLSRDLKIRLA